VPLGLQHDLIGRQTGGLPGLSGEADARTATHELLQQLSDHTPGVLEQDLVAVSLEVGPAEGYCLRLPDGGLIDDSQAKARQRMARAQASANSTA
jgi:hypothetical protein